MSKKKIFKLPYVGIESGFDEHLHLLLGLKSEISAVVEIKNPVLQYCADPDSYLSFHSSLVNLIKTIGEGHIIQKLDVLSKTQFKNKNASSEFLQKKYDEHFEGRTYNNLYSYLVITKQGVDKKIEKNLNEFKELVLKAVQSLQTSGFKPRLLKKDEINSLIYRFLSMDFNSSTIVLDNMKPTDHCIEVGNQSIKCLSLIDIDRIDLPEQVAPYTERNDNEAIKGFPVDNMSFLYSVPEFETLVYNQVVEIPKQVLTVQKLQVKRNRHTGIPDPENDMCVEDIDKLLIDVARENQLLVNAHFSISIKADNQVIQKSINSIENSLFLNGIIPSRNCYNQLELFRATLPGNAVELKNYDLYLTTSDAALTFFFKEALPVSEPATKGFSIRFTDRQGIPISIDPADYSREIGRINNRNKFVLGPSGSGKSFFMNALIEQYLLYNMDVVIVDTGDSYSGTSAYLGGKYITYRADKPVTMNPFLISEAEYNLEKKDFLVTLIALLWKGTDGSISQVERDVINDVIVNYYQNFFNKKDELWFENASIQALEKHLENYGIAIDTLFDQAKEQLLKEIGRSSQDHYAILGIDKFATIDDIKGVYRELAMVHHPDKIRNQSDQNHELFLSIKEAYETLTDLERRKNYDLSRQLTNLTLYSGGLKSEPVENNKLNVLYNSLLKRKAIELDEKFKVQSLNFNSFYEFALFLIPRMIEKENIEFEFDVFKFVLRKFYKGGEFETILNENSDSSLFNERLIIFEIDNIKENKILFPIVTLIIMDVFIQKMRFRSQQRKALIIEEAWKAIASPMMAGYILYLYKTVRKHNGEAVVVTQELDDIISNAVVKDSIINNSDTICLLDQTKFKDNYSAISKLLSINEVERRKIFTVNNLDNKVNRSPFKEVYIRRGTTGEVYGIEVSLFQYLTYTTEKPEKLAVETYANTFNGYPEGLDSFVQDFKRSQLPLSNFVMLVNFVEKPLFDKAFELLKIYRTQWGNEAITKLKADFNHSGFSRFTDWIENNEFKF
ncbi:MAG: DnaJ domain-containing protein [Prolixibacteraceae bacterium]|nr:DnaJ domain-containing protein [Prolixibacteraceae bacterium]